MKSIEYFLKKNRNGIKISPEFTPRLDMMGQNAYYWRAEENKFQDDVIISAHGGINKNAKEDLDVKGNTLLYYVDHGVVQGDFGLDKFFTPTPPNSVQTKFPGNKTYNYDLSKYQGAHENLDKYLSRDSFTPEETYRRILNKGTNIRNQNRDYLFGIGEGRKMNEVKYKLNDIVTIRYRYTPGNFFRDGLDLKTVLELISRQRGGLAANIHCFFCRSFY